MDMIIGGLKVAALVGTSSTHSFVSEQKAWGLHRKVECSESLFKEVNLVMKMIVKVVHLDPLRFGNCSGVLDSIVVPMDDQSVILG